jgi:hypothetical protein
MNISANKNAKVNIILDPSTNDKIEARGNGDLNFNMNTKSDLTIDGTYIIDEGQYNFNFQGILNKPFKIKSGSKIIFNKNPMDAELDITGLYKVKSASVKNILDTSEVNKAIRNRTFPIDLNLLISGTLNKPKIGFKIDAPEVQIDALRTILNEINTNENDVNNQAAFLLLFSSFYPTGANSDQKATGFTNTVTQIVSDQLSKIFTDGLNKLGLKGASLDVLVSDLESSSRNFDFKYKQEILGGKLILTIGGNVNFGNNTTTTSTGQPANNAAVVGDFVLEYLVTNDGTIRLKTYAKTANYDILNSDRIRTGGAISFQKEFDNIKELFPKKKKKENPPTPLPPLVKPDSTIIKFPTIKDSIVL